MVKKAHREAEGLDCGLRYRGMDCVDHYVAKNTPMSKQIELHNRKKEYV